VMDIPPTPVTSVANGSDAINVISEGSGNLTVNLTDNNDLNNTQGDGIQGSAAGSGTLRLTVDGSNSNYNGNLGSAVNIAAANNSHIIALIQDFNGVSTGTSTLNGLNVFNIQNLDTSTIEATVQNNVISGIGNNAAGIRVIQEGTGTVTAELDNNTITGLTSGIFGQARASATPGLGTLNLTLHNNLVTLTDPLANDGIDIQSGSSERHVAGVGQRDAVPGRVLDRAATAVDRAPRVARHGQPAARAGGV